MVIMLGIALVSVIAMYLLYPYCNRYVRVENTGASKKGKKYHYKKNSSSSLSGTGMSKQQEKKIGFSIFIAIFVVALLARLIGAIAYKGYEVDVNCFLAWADMIFENGIGKFYSLDAFTDYPPGYMYILFVIGGIRSAFHIVQTSTLSIVLTKLPAILSDMAIGYLVYKIASKRMKETGAALLAGIFLFTPVIFVDSAIWAQVDSVFTLFIVLMCYLVTEKKLIPAYFVFAIGILIKPQSLIFTPVLIYGIIDQVILEGHKNLSKNDFRKNFFIQLGAGIVAILMIGLLMMPFGFQDALKQYTETMGSYPYASVNAYNIWTMFGKNWADQTATSLGISYKMWGTIFIIATVIFTTILNFKSKENKSKYYFEGALIVTAVFTLSVRMHERYVYPAVALLLLVYAVRPRKKLYIAYVIGAALTYLNVTHVLFFFDNTNFDNMAPFPIIVGACFVAFLCYMVYLSYKYYIQYEPAADEKMQQTETQTARSKAGMPYSNRQDDSQSKSRIQRTETLGKIVKADLIVMAVITVIYAVIAFMNLGNMHAPTTGYSVVQDGEIVLDFGKSVDIRKTWDFLGYQNNPKYIVSISTDGTNWQEIYSDSNAWDAGSVFCWNSTDRQIVTRYLKLTPNSETANDSLLELVFQDADGNLLMPVNEKDYHALFDEQDMFEGRQSWSNGTYFDEVYHARTAYEMVHHLYCYENTHPPLGKIFIALGVSIFGMNPFGWRFMGTLFGVLMVPIIYIFAKKMFKETWISGITTLMFAFDFMHFAQTRIATIDVFVTLFIMLSYFFMFCYTRKSFYDTSLKKTFIPLGLCGIAMGFSWACKWTGIYSSIGLCLIFFIVMGKRFSEYLYASKNPNGMTEGISHKDIIDTFYKKFWKTIAFCCGFFVAIPAAIYTLSYIPFSDGTGHGLIRRMLDNQTSMFNYHSTLNATHPYSSKWYEWPIMKRPIWYFSGEINSHLREGISAFGNPLIWWMGIPAFLFILYLIYKKRDRNAIYLTFGYLSQYLPWIFIGRVVFIYHYFPSVPFVTLMIGYSMKKIVDEKPKWKKAMYVYAALVVVLFIMFYPVISGKAVDPSYVQKYLKWFDSWVLIQTW